MARDFVAEKRAQQKQRTQPDRFVYTCVQECYISSLGRRFIEGDTVPSNSEIPELKGSKYFELTTKPGSDKIKVS
jgi:hypothetical protein